MADNEQRRTLANTVPTTEVIRDAVTFPRDRLGEPLDISPARFDAWLAAEVRAAKAEAWDEGYMEATSGDDDPFANPYRYESGDQR